MMFQDNRCVPKSGRDQLVIHLKTLSIANWKARRRYTPDELSILHASTWSSSFMWTADLNAINIFRSALSDRC